MQLKEFLEKYPNKVVLKIRLYKRFLILAEKLYNDSEPDKKTPYIGEQRRSMLYGSILFLAFALESFINEIGIKYCQDDFERIDRLPTLDKWIIIPKLHSEIILFEDREPFQSISKIFTYRNLFTHFKPQFKKYSSKEYREIRNVDHKLVKRLFNRSIEAMKLLAKKFNLENSDWLETKRL